ncbi:LpqB family beta-propeller domain-containing protein [Corynebacterium sp. 335C]
MRRLRALAACAAVAATVAASGCTTLPTDSSPQVIRPFQQGQENLDVPSPDPDAGADLVLRDFYEAMAHPVDGHAAARAFLTPSAAEKWNPDRHFYVVRSFNFVPAGTDADGRRLFDVRGDFVGTLDGRGSFTQITGDGGGYEQRVAMREDPSTGQWLVDTPMQGVVIDHESLLRNYAPRNLYFVDPTANHLTPDRRWIYRDVDRTDQVLLDLLRTGPATHLNPGVSSVLSAGTRLEVVQEEGLPGRRVLIHDPEFGRGESADRLRVMLAAQITWTLTNAGLRGPWFLEIVTEGRREPLMPGGDTQVSRDTDDIRILDPNRGPADRAPLRVLSDGVLGTVTDEGVTPVPGYGGEPSQPVLLQAAIGTDSGNEEIIAGVERPADGAGPYRLIAGRRGAEPEVLLTADSLSRPTWSPDARALWTVADGHKVVRLVSDGSGMSAEEVLLTGDLATAVGDDERGIVELRIDSSGTRAALIVGTDLYVATVVQRQDGPWELTAANRLELDPGNDGLWPVTIAWAPNTTIIVGTVSADAPVWRVHPDGATNYALSRQNLTSPISMVAATSNRVYALDANGLMELVSTEGSEQFWGGVPHVDGRGNPVVAE